MGFSTSSDPKPEGIFALEMLALLLVPPLVLGVVVGVVASIEEAALAFLIGFIVGVGLASLRREIRGFRTE
ncbi:hypothetical protein [Natronobacterium texcoconense]|nr:hypothetical protein [Natronobacterium texcoconense]